MPFPLAPLLLLSAAALDGPAASATRPAACAAFQERVRATYGFRPARLGAAERTAKAEQMDAVWAAVKREPAGLVPCLKQALAAAPQDTWFQFDAAQLLVSENPSPENRRILLAALETVALDDVDLRTWVQLSAELGLAGLDTSSLGRRWLAYPDAQYYLPEHGAYHVTRDNGTLFIFGSMDERFATPALVELARSPDPETRENATWMLMSLATPEALKALPGIDPRGLSPPAAASLAALRGRPDLHAPSKTPRITRARFLAAFQAVVDGDGTAFDTLIGNAPDPEGALIAVLTPEDLPLLRRVRRRYAARGHQHAVEDYNDFSAVLMALVWKPGLVQGPGAGARP